MENFLNTNPTSRLRVLRNERGSTIVTALSIAVVVAIIIMSSTVYIRSRADAISNTSNRIDYRIAMDGLLAYTVNGIKQSWCFTDSWAQNPTCTLNDPRNTIRLIMSDESIRFIGSTTTPHPSPLEATRLNSISQTVSLSALSNSHPVFKFTTSLQKYYSSVTFTIKRDDSGIATTKGSEVRLRILITVPAGDDEHPQLDLESQVIVYPRELSYFALIMANNLYLGTTTATKGDTGLPNVSVGGDKGLRFESPVYVNGDINLPSSNLSAPMNNVVFLDKIVTAGEIYQDQMLVTPSSGGGDKSVYNHEMKSFSGLLGGYELDPQRDTGLDFLFEINGSTSNFNDDEYKLCLKRISASYNLVETKDSILWVRHEAGSTTNTFDLQASLGNVDNFVEQDLSKPDFKTDVPGVTAGTYPTWSGGAVMKARIFYEGLATSSGAGNYFTDFYIPRNGKVVLTPNGSSSANITITSSGHKFNGNDQFNRVNLNVTFNNPAGLGIGAFQQGGVTRAGAVRIAFEAYDYAYINGNNVRPETAFGPNGPLKSNGFIFIKDSGGNFNLEKSISDWSTNPALIEDLVNYAPPVPDDKPVEKDFAEIDKICLKSAEKTSGSMYASFPAAEWNTDFSVQARRAWKFSTGGAYSEGYLTSKTITGGVNSFPSADPIPFNIESLVGNCVIDSTANFVAGFFVCETLTINARSTPLRMIGTFIVGKLNIDPSAFSAGIRWSSIYHPQALYEMRAAKILGKYKDNSLIDCEDSSLPPLWSPAIGIRSAVKHYLCNPVSLRQADPFKWTMVDPDCGIDTSKDLLKTVCKAQPRRFLIKEISRPKGM